MKLLEYTIQINATPEKVWEVLLRKTIIKNGLLR